MVIYRLIPLICVALKFHTIQGDVFTSIPRMRQLYLTEGKLLDSLQASIQYHQAKLDMLVQQHKKILSQRTRDGDTREYLDHPVDGFSLIKRLSRDWPLIMNIMAGNHKIPPSLLQDMQTFNEDTQGAIRGLTRLQKVYELDTDQLSDGWVANSQAFSKLNAADCVEVAQFLSQRHEFVLATTWLRAAQRRVNQENDTTVSQNQLASMLYTYSTLAMCEQADLSPGLHHSLLSYDPSYTPDADTAKLFRFTLDQNCSWYDSTLKWDKTDMAEENHKKFNTMCRGEPKGPKGLKCHYVHYHRPELLLAPFKLEEILISPPIVLVHQAISESEIEDLKNASLNKLSDCQTMHNATLSKTSTYRTCDKGWVDDSATPTAARITRRIGQLANLGMTHSEQHQVACYGLGGEYKLHKDALQGTSLSETNRQGQRIATVMLYLNNVTRGGYTVFPLLKVAVAPIKGSAVYWYNILHDSKDDDRSLHGGCPVLLGSKWVLNKWIREGGQEFQSLHCPSDKHFPREYFYV
ncbi:prolyl 4-hydroxylase subunit alpha-2-like isoform X4 [Homalodisca vitripennis]|uniref:prolyl 4-hydroxylase subunit alpha-2-like isoform X4 n=1 Tax=Homalodisca vitripennis TaxID=197043 RepID=UPI001EE9D5BA|nr:prolyl 4-hydroxylase subunit alpha-2-like isoform X4 [Homalodisca vitripennis]